MSWTALGKVLATSVVTLICALIVWAIVKYYREGRRPAPGTPEQQPDRERQNQKGRLDKVWSFLGRFIRNVPIMIGLCVLGSALFFVTTEVIKYMRYIDGPGPAGTVQTQTPTAVPAVVGPPVPELRDAVERLMVHLEDQARRLGWHYLDDECTLMTFTERGWYLLPVNASLLAGGTVRATFASTWQYYDSRGRRIGEASPFLVGMFEPNGHERRLIPEDGPCYALYLPRDDTSTPAAGTMRFAVSAPEGAGYSRLVFERALNGTPSQRAAVSVCTLPAQVDGTEVSYDLAMYFLPPLASGRRLHNTPYGGRWFDQQAEPPTLLAAHRNLLRRHPPQVVLVLPGGQAVAEELISQDALYLDSHTISSRLAELGRPMSDVTLQVVTQFATTVQVAIRYQFGPSSQDPVGDSDNPFR